jgi:cell division protein FtsZ
VDFSHIKDMMMRGGGALMTIGHGKGEDKAEKAIHQALNHPLLESIDLEHAAGVIANFTGGEDLTLPEVGKALNKIQKMAGGSVDLVMGFNNDDRLEDRVQVILVVTGLGAQTLEEIIPGFETKVSPNEPLKEFIEDVPPPVPVEEVIEEPQPEITQPRQSPAWNQFQVAPEPAKAAMPDLDIPAFLRRRMAKQDKLEPQANQAH